MLYKSKYFNSFVIFIKQVNTSITLKKNLLHVHYQNKLIFYNGTGKLDLYLNFE